MKNKIMLLLLMMVVFTGLAAASAADPAEASNNTATLIVEYDQPMTPSEMVNLVQVQPFYKNYNHTTLEWLKGFGSDYVFLSNDDYYILMNSTDADKLAGNGKTGVSFTNNVTCTILENRSLGNDLLDVLYIEDVVVNSNETQNFDFDNS